MLITFTSKAYPDVVMFGDVATRLLHAMGQREQPPGILRGEEIKVAAERLRAYLNATSKDSTTEDEGKDKPDDKRKEQQRNRVGLRTRALPLLDMMDVSYNKDVDVIWR